MTAPSSGDYGLLSDCHTAALVSRHGAVDWCCMPRFDSASCFGRLLSPGAGTCVVDSEDHSDGAMPRRRYVDGTLVLETTLESAGGTARVLDFLAAPAPAHRGHERRTLVRIVEAQRRAVPIRIRVRPRFDYGELAPWLRDHGGGLFSAVGGADGLLCWSDAALTPDEDDGLSARAVLAAGRRLRLVVQFRRPEELDGRPADAPDAETADRWLEETIRWWRTWSVPRPASQDELAARRSAVVLKGLTFAPTGAMVAAPTTSLPETIRGRRTWDYRYSWIRDSVLATHALTRLGHDAEADAFRRFIERSAAGDPRALRVFYGVGGERRLPEIELGHLDGDEQAGPVRIGNAAVDQLQLDAYGQLVTQSWHWCLRGHQPDDDYWRFLRRLVDSAAERWTEPDRGIWEWRGEPRHFVHSKALCWAALEHGLRLAERCGRDAPVGRWRKARDDVRDAIESEGFDRARRTYVQAFGDTALDAALLRLPAIGYLPHDDPRMVGTVDAARSALDDDGLLRRYEVCDELPGQEGAFVACSFWLVECLANQGRTAEARRSFDRALATANDLGLFPEEFSTREGVPLGNFPQALTHLAHIEAAAALTALPTAQPRATSS